MEQQQTLISADAGLPPEQAMSPDPGMVKLEEAWTSILPLLKDGSITYDKATGQFVDVERKEAELVCQRTASRKESFAKLMATWDAEHDKTVAELKSQRHRNRWNHKETLVAQIRFDIVSGSHSWKDIFDLVNNAKDSYENPTGTGVMRKWFRKTADKAEYVEPFVGFIPDTEYTSVICAGFKFIIGACKGSRTARERAFDLVSQLPEKVDIAGQYSELYSSDSNLQKATNELYCDILSAMEGLIYWLTKAHTLEWLKPLFQQTSYDPSDGMIDRVGRSSRQVENAVKLCDSKKLSEIGRRVDDTSIMLLSFISAQFKQAKWLEQWVLYFASLNKQPGKHEQDSQPQSYISQKELLQLLRGSVSSSKTSITTLQSVYATSAQKVLQIGFSMDTADQARSKWLMANKKIIHWFRANRSRTLLVNGNGKLDRVTPVSFFCAILAHSLACIDSIVVLSHFCGLARSPGDPRPQKRRPGSSELLRSLVTQLVLLWRFGDLTCLGKNQVERLYRNAPELSLREERRLFRKLVASLPSGQPLFIIVDGINYCETSEFKAETKEVVAEVNALLDNDNVGAQIKILVTNATRSFALDKHFEEDEKVEMPVSILENMTGFADSQFVRNFGNAVNRLQNMPDGKQSA